MMFFSCVPNFCFSVLHETSLTKRSAFGMFGGRTIPCSCWTPISSAESQGSMIAFSSYRVSAGVIEGPGTNPCCGALNEDGAIAPPAANAPTPPPTESGVITSTPPPTEPGVIAPTLPNAEPGSIVITPASMEPGTDTPTELETRPWDDGLPVGKPDTPGSAWEVAGIPVDIPGRPSEDGTPVGTPDTPEIPWGDGIPDTPGIPWEDKFPVGTPDIAGTS